jgi:hypothetical protein
MSSWFNVESITKSVTDAINVDSIKQLTDKVQQAIPKIDSEMLEKLTLTTPELTAERQRIDEEEKRKEQVRDSLAGLLPWETRDPERDILVEECRDAMLQLSQTRESFFGPYPMPKRHADKEEEEEEPGKDKPSADSLEKLAKLEPLPALLQEFDLDAHVGLINRLLKEDKKLEVMQSELSGKLSLSCDNGNHVDLIVPKVSHENLSICRRRRTRTRLLEKLLFPLRVYSL